MMRKRHIVIVVAVALAFGAGILVQRHFQLAPVRVSEAFIRDLSGADDSLPPAPGWEEWLYPGAKSKGNITGSSLRLNGDLILPPGRYALFLTPDEFEDVARFYARKLQFDEPDDVAQSHSAVSSYGRFPGGSNHLLDDFHDSTDPQGLRPVRAKCMLRRTPSFDLTVFLTRADEENQTHIVVLYDPKNAT